MIPKRYASGFSIGLMAKDLRTADDLARQLGVPVPLSRAVSALWAEASEDLGPQADHTAIDAFVAKPRSERA